VISKQEGQNPEQEEKDTLANFHLMQVFGHWLVYDLVIDGASIVKFPPTSYLRRAGQENETECGRGEGI
jgi:hypothetical protein